jgi:hypothetical protein
MKIKQDFITNSSSSSFIIACKNDLTKEQIKQKIIKVINLPENSILKEIDKEIADCFCYDMEKKDLIQFFDDRGYSHYKQDKERQELSEKFSKYPFIWDGSVSSDGEGIEPWVCDYLELNYKDDEIIIEKEYGY